MSKFLLKFDENCPSNMGRSQLVDDVASFVKERESLLPNAVITATSLKCDTCAAKITKVADDYDNSKD